MPLSNDTRWRETEKYGKLIMLYSGLSTGWGAILPYSTIDGRFLKNKNVIMNINGYLVVVWAKTHAKLGELFLADRYKGQFRN